MRFLSERLGVANGAIIPKLGLVLSFLLLGLYVLLSIVSLPRLRNTAAAKTGAPGRDRPAASLPRTLSDSI